MFRDNFVLWWNECVCLGWEGFRFMRKLKLIKEKVKKWKRETLGNLNRQKGEIYERIEEIDALEVFCRFG